tara:strand:- start:161 stop:373 length:213 start_codon:yes stop_codon:yes gene_type:complete
LYLVPFQSCSQSSPPGRAATAALRAATAATPKFTTGGGTTGRMPKRGTTGGGTTGGGTTGGGTTGGGGGR